MASLFETLMVGKANYPGTADIRAALEEAAQIPEVDGWDNVGAVEDMEYATVEPIKRIGPSADNIELEIPDDLLSDYDVDKLRDLGIEIDGRKATVCVVDGNIFMPHGRNSYSGRFLSDLQDSNEAVLSAQAHEARAADGTDRVSQEIEKLDMIISPQQTEDGTSEYLVDFKEGTPGYHHGDASTPASAAVVSSLDEALATAKEMASYRDEVLQSISNEQSAIREMRAAYCVLSAEEMSKAVKVWREDARLSSAVDINGNGVSLVLTEEGLTAITSSGQALRTVKENSNAHLAEVKAQFADHDISISSTASGHFHVDFHPDSIGYFTGTDSSGTDHDGLIDAVSDAKDRVRWRASQESTAQVETNGSHQFVMDHAEFFAR